ncbi:Mediator of cell motility 1 [Paragonimus heterotremus]|uniref:Mediator of cell motility 1 n=1 Tax=Paragonimus heterotremus TaxID=100268 RepID=A0A8J4SRQ9_9TREM|nr:Mediator of cell motility 1 [Paragonimus heterotremus]
MSLNVGQRSIRRDSHAGSWYSKDSVKLDSQLSEWLSRANVDRRPSRAIITPYVLFFKRWFKVLDMLENEFSSSVLPITSEYLGNALSPLPILALHRCTPSTLIKKELHKTGEFISLSIENDEQEHSVEMQLPYIAKVMEKYRGCFKIVPVVVGSLSPNREAVYGQIFAHYLNNPENVFVISSDFCHWGRRFQYTYYNQDKGAIWQSIQALDEEGMNIIERLAPAAFTTYLNNYGNTICGRHPIGILLQAVEALHSNSPTGRFDFKFVKYAQSERCRNMSDSSVSYAAGSLLIR